MQHLKGSTSADAPQITRVLISQLESLEILDSYTLSDWSLFWNQQKTKQLQTDNYNCQISQISQI